MSLCRSVLQDLQRGLKNLRRAPNLQVLGLGLPEDGKHVRGSGRRALPGRRNGDVKHVFFKFFFKTVNKPFVAAHRLLVRRSAWCTI